MDILTTSFQEGRGAVKSVGWLWKSVMWDRVDYVFKQFDGLRTVAVEQDGMIVASGFVQGDESDTIFVVYAGSAVVMKVDPSDGEVVWESVHALASRLLSLYSAGVMYDEGLSITKRTADGKSLMLLGRHLDLAIGSNNDLYYGGRCWPATCRFRCIRLKTWNG